MARLLLITCLFLIFIACRKEGAVTGRVTNYSDGKPIAGIIFDIYQGHGGGIGWTGVYKSQKLDEVTTDANGSFNIDLKYKKRDSYDYSVVMRMDRDKAIDTSALYETYYFLFEPYEPHHSLSKNKSENLEFKMRTGARIKFIPVDLPPYGHREFVAYAGDSIGEGFREDIYTQGQSGFEYKRVPSNGKVFVYFNEISDTLTNYYYGTLMLAPFGKGTFYYYY